MVSSRSSAALLLLVFLNSLSTEAQLRCYECNSFTDGARGASCHSPMGPNVSTVTCGTDFVCSTVSYVTGQILVTSRSCDPRQNTCSNIESTLRGFYPDLRQFSCRACSSNYCNSGHGVGISIVLATVCLIMAKVI